MKLWKIAVHARSSVPVNDVDWPLHAIHPVYGEVVMAGTTGGEKYRWFEKKEDGIPVVSMIPLDALEPYEKNHG